jgi:hypothetical protein
MQRSARVGVGRCKGPVNGCRCQVSWSECRERNGRQVTGCGGEGRIWRGDQHSSGMADEVASRRLVDCERT